MLESCSRVAPRSIDCVLCTDEQQKQEESFLEARQRQRVERKAERNGCGFEVMEGLDRKWLIVHCRKGNRFMVVTGVTEGPREVSIYFCVCQYSQPSVNEHTVRRCVQIGAVSVLTFECRSWHMIPLVENILYLTFLDCLALSRTKFLEQIRTFDSRSTPIHLTTCQTSVVARWDSRFEDCVTWLV